MRKRNAKGQFEATPEPLRPQTQTQEEYLALLQHCSLLVSHGPAGSGKTYIPTAYAAQMLMDHTINKIVLTRPNVPAGPSLGYMPGDFREEVAPWCIPFFEIFRQRMGEVDFQAARDRKEIEIATLETMRGRTFDHAFVIVDEAQNITPREMEMVLTRKGEDTIMVVNGDTDQTDLPEGMNGLDDLIDLIRAQSLSIPVIEFTVEDIVRSADCKMIARAYAERRKNNL
jgi:phosphate starvation-inducible PhoH-like protein